MSKNIPSDERSVVSSHTGLLQSSAHVCPLKLFINLYDSIMTAMLQPGTKISNNKWTVDQRIGIGACGEVFSLKEVDPRAGNLVVKCVKLPTGKGKKAKEQTQVANTLNYERMLYRGILTDFEYAPQLPLFNCYGEENGYRYLVMQRLDYDLKYMASSAEQPSLRSVGLVGEKLLDGLKALHRKGYVFVDTKPDNFMIVKNKVKNYKSSEFTTEDKLYFVDFGLCEKYTQYMLGGASRERVQRPGLAGTATYASLDAIDGYCAAPKDDIEALGYVLLSLRLGGRLPWDSATSLDEVRRIKRTTDINILAASAGCPELGAFITAARDIPYESIPDYDKFDELLANMKCRDGNRKRNPETTAPSSRKKNTKKRSSTAATEHEDYPGGTTSHLPPDITRCKASTKKRKINNIDSEPSSVPDVQKSSQTTVRAAQVVDLSENDVQNSSQSKVTTEHEVCPGFATPQLLPDSTMRKASMNKRRRTDSNSQVPPIPDVVDLSENNGQESSKSSENNRYCNTTVKFVVRSCEGCPDYVGRQFPLLLDLGEVTDGSEFTIGASDDCDIALPNDIYLSGRHAVLRCKMRRRHCTFDIKGLQCLNDSRINDNVLLPNRWYSFSSGDIIVLGGTMFSVLVSQ